MSKKFFQLKLIFVLFLLFLGVFLADAVFACDSNNCTPCVSHTCKQCVGSTIYWFDSCGNMEDLYQTCGSKQICQYGKCVDVTCLTNADCGTNIYLGSPYCQSGKVYQDYKAYKCNNPGTTSSFCSDSTAPKLKKTCGSNQICSGGECINIVCDANSDCGTSGYVDNPFCQSGNVYQNYKTYTCNNPGTTNSSCSNSTAPKLKTTCGTNQGCSDGVCKDIVCSSGSDCGTSGYVDNPFCQSGNVYQNYKTYTCNNPGTTNSSCSNSTAPKLKTTCGTNQDCSDGSCVQQSGFNVSCYATPNPVTTDQDVIFVANPSNGLLYYSYHWSGACSGISYNCYNSFSQAGTHTAQVTVTSTSTGQTVSATCSVVVNQGCTSNYSKRCVNNNLYWFDSCGNRQNVYQYCQYGCQNNTCITQNMSVQTNPATNNYNNQATLNGYVYGIDSYSENYAWFQWGTSTLYGHETPHQNKNYSGSFNQNIASLTPGTTYHFRAVAQNVYGNMVYGSDLTFVAGSTTQTGNLISVSKTARNISSANLNWSNIVYANPSDFLMFMITIKAIGNQNVNNITIKDVFPSNLIYKNNLVISGTSNYTGDITSLMSLGTISDGQTITIIYQAQVAPLDYFSFGTTTLNNSVSVTSSEEGYNPASNVAIVVTKTGALGATAISTGLTNNIWVDSFFLPLMAALIGVWIFKSDLFGVEKWIDGRKAVNSEYKTQKQLKAKINKIKESERN